MGPVERLVSHHRRRSDVRAWCCERLLRRPSKRQINAEALCPTSDVLKAFVAIYLSGEAGRTEKALELDFGGRQRCVQQRLRLNGGTDDHVPCKLIRSCF